MATIKKKRQRTVRASGRRRRGAAVASRGRVSGGAVARVGSGGRSDSTGVVSTSRSVLVVERLLLLVLLCSGDHRGDLVPRGRVTGTDRSRRLGACFSGCATPKSVFEREVTPSRDAAEKEEEERTVSSSSASGGTSSGRVVGVGRLHDMFFERKDEERRREKRRKSRGRTTREQGIVAVCLRR